MDNILSPEQVISKFGQMAGDRSIWETHWEDLADMNIPRKNGITGQKSPGDRRYDFLLDSTSMVSCESLAGALHGMLTNPQGFFFGMTTGVPNLDQRDDVRMYIQGTVRNLHEILNNSNFQTELHEIYLDLVGFGNATLDIEEDVQDVVRFNARPIQEIYFEENSKGRVDMVMRKYTLDARGIVDEFGEEALTDKIKECYKNGKPEKFEILHYVYPRPKTAKPYRNMIFPFVSQYVLKSEKKNLRVKGFREFPQVITRWSKASGEVYGRGVAEKALPDANTVNEMTKTTLRGAQKVVDPPLQAPDDGFLLPLITKPGGLNFYRAGTPEKDRIAPIFNDSRIDFGFQSIEQKQRAIREAFYVDQLKLREGPQMTATEVDTRVDQALRLMGPMMGRQHVEFLRPTIERVFRIAERRGLLPEVPEVLRNRPLMVYYTSLAAAAQRMAEAQNINRTMAAVVPFASNEPAVLDVFDGVKTAKYLAKLYNFPQELIRSEDDFQRIQQQKQAAAQAQMQAQQDALKKDSDAKIVSAAAKLQA